VSPATAALDDVLVVDLTETFWGSLGVALLADFGARSVRVEPVAGEHAPGEPPGWDALAELCQRNKQSLALDLGGEPGRALLRDLVAQADVFASDWSRARLEACGLDYATLSRARPDLIYAHGSGFGPEGPDRDLPALDELAAARTGMMPILPQPGEPPVYAGAGEMYTAAMLAFGVATALVHRQQTGAGQEVDVSLFAGNLYGASLDLQAFLAMGGERFLHPVDRLDAGNPMSGTLYPAKDGLWVTLTMPDTDRWWPLLAPEVGLDPADPRFDSHEKRCGEGRLELIRVLERAFAREPAAHWRRVFTERQMSADIIEDFSYPANDPQAAANRYVLELDRPGLGRVKTLGFPIHMGESPARLASAAPSRGQHTAAVLHDVLGLSEERIAELRARGVVG
jgi:formyl-CoA transferase